MSVLSPADGEQRQDAQYGEPMRGRRKDEWVGHPVGWLVGLFAIALLIRLTYLAAKPAWMDEVSTILFSLGNYSRLIPTDRVISLAQMVRPLQLTPGATAADAVTNLLAENNHPPAYFALAHGWMMAFHRMVGDLGRAGDGAVYASVWASRALPALFGALAVPVSYGLAWLSFGGEGAGERLEARRIGLLCAALMAVSPFSVFLSQEARHYTLAILTVMGSLCCFALAVRAVLQRRPVGWLTVALWVGVNALGIAVHYFCGLTYVMEGLVLLVLLVRECLKDGAAWHRGHWVRIYVVAVGTALGALVWLPVLLNFYGSPQTTYITSGSRGLKFWLGPIAQSVVGWIYAVFSPVTSGYGWPAVTLIVVSCVLLLFGFLPWFVGNWVRSLRFQWAKQTLRPGLLAMGGFFLVGNLVFLLICYGAGFDITRGHRYSFVFYPSIVILVGAGLAPFWSAEGRGVPRRGARGVSRGEGFSWVKLPFVRRYVGGRTFVLIVLFVGFLGAQTIVLDRTHLKFYKADRFVDFMQANSSYPVYVSTSTVTGEQPSVLGIEILSAAWEVQRQLAAEAGGASAWPSEPKFILLERNLLTDSDPNARIEEMVLDEALMPRPFDLWMIGMVPILKKEGCSDPMRGNKGSFAYSHYVCPVR
ncbi:MAG: hypothetical protein AAFS06_13595 [Cyanobacteria bacterium J06631_12]